MHELIYVSDDGRYQIEVAYRPGNVYQIMWRYEDQVGSTTVPAWMWSRVFLEIYRLGRGEEDE